MCWKWTLRWWKCCKGIHSQPSSIFPLSSLILFKCWDRDEVNVKNSKIKTMPMLKMQRDKYNRSWKWKIRWCKCCKRKTHSGFKCWDAMHGYDSADVETIKQRTCICWCLTFLPTSLLCRFIKARTSFVGPGAEADDDVTSAAAAATLTLSCASTKVSANQMP